MAVLVDTLYGEKCCNKDIGKISYEICKRCKHKVSLSKTFVTCHLDTNKTKVTNMITEDYVSFEVAKLLKEKGFNEYCKSIYHVGSLCSVASLKYHDNEGYGELIEEKQNSDFGKYDNAISAPTLQMAMKWLREVHNRYVEICMDKAHNFKDIVFRTAIYDKSLDCLWESDNISTYEQACEAAIKYCLENLI